MPFSFCRSLVSILISTLSAHSACAHAQGSAYPVKSIRFQVGVAPGGGTDFAARLIGARLAEKFGQPVITDNRAGATGNIALELTAEAAPDGYTFVVFNLGHLTSALLPRNARIDAARDFPAVSPIATGNLMLATRANVAACNLKDCAAFARTQPGQMNYGAGGLASTHHLAMELLKREARLDLIHGPYQGTGPIALDLVSGQIRAAISNRLGL